MELSRFPEYRCRWSRSRPALAKAFLQQAATLFLSGEPAAACRKLRVLVNASRSLQRMLSGQGKSKHGQPGGNFRCEEEMPKDSPSARVVSPQSATARGTLG